jgi:hypothetical protein
VDSNNLSSQFYGKGSEALFPEGSFDVRPAPWPSASKERHRKDWDSDAVRSLLREPPELSEVDPRELHASQRSITRQGLNYYMADDYRKTGETYADKGREANRFPVVYKREPGKTGRPENVILTGHHRAAAALAKGEPLRARIVEGPWGKPR